MTKQKLEIYNIFEGYSWSLGKSRTQDAIKNNMEQGWKIVSTSFVQRIMNGDTEKAELWVIYEKDNNSEKSSPQIT